VNSKEELFQFSNEKEKFFDSYYKKKGWPCKRIRGPENKKYNCLVEIDGKKWKFEEKARAEDYGDFLVELIQDIETKSPGWLYYCEADYILYSTPGCFYAINFHKLKKFMKRHGHKYPIKVSEKGWGKTTNAAVPWDDLMAEKVAQKIIKEIA